MNQLMNPVLKMSSREIAELTGKEHKNVCRVIRDLISDGILDAQLEPLKFEYRGQWFDYYELNKRDSFVVVARLSPEFTAHIVDRWQELEQQLNPVFNLPQDLPTALRVLADTHEQLQQAQLEREIAVKTKAYISDKKTATAMATASNAVQENTRLKDKLGQSKRNATVLAVERLTGKEYTWQALNKWCKAHGVKPQKVHDDRYGKVNTYPAQAWSDVYGVNLLALFGGI
ncbi:MULTISPECIES: Rha family transcriptional regulator [unclassified Acinetobacter]|uniref:Rha family transcriptional regulator n=1 Tax=unclassified Acinetobacter TaxID=196816 RepID=UPI00293442E3|nr:MULTISPECIES: Rha family transcriptional regulator [unclassified Acinetobacter]WOE31014.1 Rha family transcriptional regulator [Acinetobacter sp. SAAs470]WOE39210.1 Rha family transcriptional regulator [Acinetobacter sp. SAAs474]